MSARDKSETIGQNEEAIQYYDDTVNPVVETPFNPAYYRKHRECHGYDTKNFRARQAAGELLPLTPWEQYFEEGEVRSTWSINWIDGRKHWTTPNHGDYQASYRPSIELMRTYAAEFDYHDQVQRAAAKIYSSGFDALTFLIEFHKTVDLFMNLGKSLLEILRKGNPSQTWLEYRYGWRILYYEMVELAEVISNMDTRMKRYKQTSGASFGGQVKTYTVQRTESSQWLVMASIVDNINASVRGTVIADIEPPRFSFNPALTAWELIKFSFIIDWIIGVGQWIASSSFLLLQSQYVAAGGVKLDVTRVITTHAEPKNGSYIAACTWNTLGSVQCDYTIRIPTSVPLIPQFNIDIDLSKILDLLALIFKSRRLW